MAHQTPEQRRTELSWLAALIVFAAAVILIGYRAMYINHADHKRQHAIESQSIIKPPPPRSGDFSFIIYF